MKLNKKSLTRKLNKKILVKLSEKKKNLAKNIITEAEVAPKAPAPKAPAPKVAAVKVSPKVDPEENGKKESDVQVAKFRLGRNEYRYQFVMGNKIYVVDFVPTDPNAMNFKASFYVKGQKDSDKPVTKYGITSIPAITPVFKNVLNVIEQFLQMRKPMELRLVPGKVAYPTVFHQYIHELLVPFRDTMKNRYSVFRGDKSGAAFVLKKGGSRGNIQTKTWRPQQSAMPKQKAKEVDEAIDGPTKEILQKAYDAIAAIYNKSKALSDLEKEFKVKNVKLDSKGQIMSFDRTDWSPDPLFS